MFGRRSVVFAGGAAISGLFVYLALRGIDMHELKAAFADAELMPWLPLALALFSLGYLLRGVRCRLLVRRSADISFATATNVVVIGYAANNVLPARLGELVRAGMLAERANVPVSQSLGVTFIERVLDGLALLFLLVAGTLTLDVPGWMDELVVVAGAVFGIATVVMFLGALRPSFVISVAGRIGGLLGTKWRQRLSKLATNVTNAGACLRDPKDAVVLFGYSLAIWCFESSIYVFLLPVFGIPLSFQTGLITMCVTGFGLLLPSSPGFIGPFHYFASQTLMIFGVSHSTALAYASLVHLSFFVPLTVAGGCVMVWYGVALGSTAARARAAAAAEATRALDAACGSAE